MDFFDIPFFQSFVSNALATLLGIAFGIPVGLFLDNCVEKITERKRKKKILLVLKDELLKNKSLLDEYKSKRKGEIVYLTTKLRDESWNAFSDGGEIKWINDPELLGLISESYYSISALMDLSNNCFALFFLSTSDKGSIQLSVRESYKTLIPEAIENTNNKITYILTIINDQINSL